LLGQRLVALGLLGLAPQRGDLAVEPGHQVLEPGEVGLGLPELALGVAAADVQAGDAAASSSIMRRSAGLAAITAAILPWLTSAGLCAPVAASANTSATSLARTSRPLTR
jgi:hypothetical protein